MHVMKAMMKIPLVLDPQKEGGWTITSPLVPELVTEIDELVDLNSRVHDALAAVIELYQDMGKQFPANLRADDGEAPVLFESLVMAEG
jgi:antitoxin HicB